MIDQAARLTQQRRAPRRVGVAERLRVERLGEFQRRLPASGDLRLAEGASLDLETLLAQF
ncbi:MAG: hypothetical protein ACREU3_18285 [Steroidobacteraceae bacterium]